MTILQDALIKAKSNTNMTVAAKSTMTFICSEVKKLLEAGDLAGARATAQEVRDNARQLVTASIEGTQAATVVNSSTGEPV